MFSLAPHAPQAVRRPNFRPARALAILLLASGTVLFSTGCWGMKIRELRTEKQMKEARILQLQQDMTALKDENETLKQKVTVLETDLKATSEKAGAAHLALSTSTESTSRELAKNLTGSIENEAKLKAQVEQLEAKISLLDTQLIDAKASKDEVEKDLKLKNAELAAAEKTLAEMRGMSEAQRKQLEDTSKSVDVRSKEAAELTQKTTALSSDLRLASDKLAESEKQLAAARTELEALKSDVKAKEAAAAAEKETAAAKGASPEAVKAAEEAVRTALNGVGRVSSDERGVRIALASDDVFQPGTVLLSDTGLRSLAACVEALKAVPAKQIIIEGHTDNVPVKNMPYPDNWELASARANEVLRWLAAKPGLDPAKFASQSRAYYAPVAKNDDPAGRKQNRRVEIVLEL
jgi:chemotaxis protein MotB